mmetsp:Transcript_86003/g.152349  ORF Transcript_86003/g.152349 Transcript_86003/m.152349 type:complete len:121 (+) Transcript_86003:64-426(+)
MISQCLSLQISSQKRSDIFSEALSACTEPFLELAAELSLDFPLLPGNGIIAELLSSKRGGNPRCADRVLRMAALDDGSEGENHVGADLKANVLSDVSQLALTATGSKSATATSSIQEVRA